MRERSIRVPPARSGFARHALLAAIDALAAVCARAGLRCRLRARSVAARAHRDGACGFSATRLRRRVGQGSASAWPGCSAASDCRIRKSAARRPASARDGVARKQRGGSGGGHVGRPHAGAAAAQGNIFSAGCGPAGLGAVRRRWPRARVMGFSEQWAAPAADAPFRYGGCAGPVTPPPRLARAIAERCDALAVATGLVGLNSLDLLVEEERLSVTRGQSAPRRHARCLRRERRALAVARCISRRVAGRLPPPMRSRMRIRRAPPRSSMRPAPSRSRRHGLAALDRRPRAGRQLRAARRADMHRSRGGGDSRAAALASRRSRRELLRPARRCREPPRITREA